MNVKLNEKHIILGVVGGAFLIMLLTASICVMAGNDVPDDYFGFMKELATFFLGGSAVALFANGAKNGLNYGVGKLNGSSKPASPLITNSYPPRPVEPPDLSQPPAATFPEGAGGPPPG